MAVQPVSAGTPVHLAHMHHIAGQPHAGVVVQVARGVQRAHGAVDGGHTRAAFANIVRHGVGVATWPRQAALHVAQNPIATVGRVLPDMVKKLAPCKLKHQLVFKT